MRDGRQDRRPCFTSLCCSLSRRYTGRRPLYARKRTVGRCFDVCTLVPGRCSGGTDGRNKGWPRNEEECALLPPDDEFSQNGRPVKASVKVRKSMEDVVLSLERSPASLDVVEVTVQRSSWWRASVEKGWRGHPLKGRRWKDILITRR
jgi:hypothetical protein